jgi:YfiH family protein
VNPLRTTTLPAFDAIPGLLHGFERRLPACGRESREAGRARVAAALAARGRLHLLKQAHGARVARAPWQGFPEADAATAAAPGLLLGIETADCLPILLVDPQRRAVAAIHAGWRGTAAGVTRAGVAALVADGSRVDDLLAALGPCIGACCYEVGEELRTAFGSAAEGLFRHGPRGRPHFDLRLANARQLEASGVKPACVGHVAECTFCVRDAYHSFRREGAGAGRMLSFVGFEV